MRLPFLKPQAATADDALSGQAARSRARRRLAGALVLLVIGVVGFPIVFETQPRPLPVDTPIVVGSTRVAPTPAAAPARPAPLPVGQSVEIDPVAGPPAVAAAPPSPPAAASRPAPLPVITERAEPAPAPVATAASAARTAPPPPPVAAASAAGRFVVQVGAYTDAATLRDARARVEKLDLKTYTQVVNSEAGARTRVRLGPFATRDEADAAAAKVKRAGLPAAIVTL